MEITKQQHPDALELKLQGRLDAYWSDHLSTVIEEAVRGGKHHLRLNFAEVGYLSSAGIRVLVKHFKQLYSIQGSLTLVAPSAAVTAVLDMAGLAGTLIAKPAAAETVSVVKPARSFESEHALFDVFDLAPKSALKCSLWGKPAKFASASFEESDCHQEEFRENMLGIGLGALGSGFADCRGRFGEFLAVAGAAAYLPTDGSNTPDYMVAEGLLVPRIHTLHSVTATGSPARLARFEVNPAAARSVLLTELVSSALIVAGSKTAGFVMIAESAGLVGASLKRSPVKTEGDAAPLQFPAVRDWLSFTTERAFDRTLALVVGFIARGDSNTLGAVLRPMGSESGLSAHLHAAVFHYRPLQRGFLEMNATVKSLFSTEALHALLHLVVDDRKFDGVGQSEFFRGACWVTPVAETGGTP